MNTFKWRPMLALLISTSLFSTHLALADRDDDDYDDSDDSDNSSESKDIENDLEKSLELPPSTLPPTTFIANLTWPNDNVTFCQNQSCVTVTKATQQCYARLFFTEDDLQQLQQQWYLQHMTDDNGAVVRKLLSTEFADSDHDRCCPTHTEYNPVTSLVNVQGQERVIAHFTSSQPPRYQLVPRGTCVQGQNNCDGRCRQVEQLAVLLVLDFNSPQAPLTFDSFQLPAYCSCKTN